VASTYDRAVRRPLLFVAAFLALAGCTSTTARPLFRPAPGGVPSVAPLGVPGESTPIADPIYPDYGNPAIDVLHYGLDLSWDTKTFTGQAAITLRAVKAVAAVTLDFSPAYTVDGATLDGKPVTATIKGGDLTVPATLAAAAKATLVVKYHGVPAPVPMPSHRSDVEPLGLTVTSDGLLWTMQEPYGSSTWYPSNDQPSDKALYDIAITVPPGWAGVASGTPDGQTGNTFRYTSKDPVATYLTTLAVGRFTKETATGPHGIPLTYWYRKGAGDKIMDVVRRSPSYLEWLESRFGPYPFPSAGVLVVPSDSGMETQQMITLGEGIAGASVDEVDADLLHEYAHQWFGDAVTPSTWSDLWLNEGFADYAQYLYTNGKQGISQAAWEKRFRPYDADLRSRLGPPGKPEPDRFAESNVYICPALMLEQIRKQIGDAGFFALARDWVQQHKGSNQDRATFIAFVNAHTGKNFTALINTWLDSPTTPT
jgi:aminopeptidase N